MLLQLRCRIALTALAFSLLALLARPAAAADLDVHVPPDTEMLVTVNVRGIVDSPLFKKHAAAARAALNGINEVEDVLKDLGFDPFKDLDRVIAASPGGGDKGLVIVQGKFDLTKFKDKGAEAARDNGDVLKIHKIGDGAGGQFTVYEVVMPDDESLFVALASAKTMLVSPGKDYVVEALKRGKTKKKATLKNKDFQALVEKMDVKQSVSVAVLGKALKGPLLAEAPQVVKDLAESIEAIGGGITFADDVKLEVVVSAKSVREAATFKEAAEKGVKVGAAALGLLPDPPKQVDALIEVLRTVRFSVKGKVVTIRARVTAEVLKGALKKEE